MTGDRVDTVWSKVGVDLVWVRLRKVEEWVVLMLCSSRMGLTSLGWKKKTRRSGKANKDLEIS